jgi:hypothetical protein
MLNRIKKGVKYYDDTAMIKKFVFLRRVRQIIEDCESPKRTPKMVLEHATWMANGLVNNFVKSQWYEPYMGANKKVIKYFCRQYAVYVNHFIRFIEETDSVLKPALYSLLYDYFYVYSLYFVELYLFITFEQMFATHSNGAVKMMRLLGPEQMTIRMLKLCIVAVRRLNNPHITEACLHMLKDDHLSDAVPSCILGAYVSVRDAFPRSDNAGLYEGLANMLSIYASDTLEGMIARETAPIQCALQSYLPSKRLTDFPPEVLKTIQNASLIIGILSDTLNVQNNSHSYVRRWLDERGNLDGIVEKTIQLGVSFTLCYRMTMMMNGGITPEQDGIANGLSAATILIFSLMIATFPDYFTQPYRAKMTNLGIQFPEDFKDLLRTFANRRRI